MEEREHPATERQRKRFAERGEVAHSRDLVAAGAVASAGLAVAGTLPGAVAALGALATTTLGNLGTPLDGHLAAQAGRSLLGAALPPLAAAAGAALLLGLGQSGGQVRTSVLGPRFERLDPLPRLAQLFGSRQALAGVGLALLKVVTVGAVVASTLSSRLPGLVSEPATGLGPTLSRVGALLSTLGVRCAVALAALGAADYALNRFRLEQRMRMTTQEVKEDAKEDNGDPLVRSQRRRRQRELARARSVRSVAKADVVVTNPTHFAVALAYDSRRMSAPRVLAKGADAAAARIRAEARKAGVLIVPDPPLARLLYRRVKVGREVPADLYQAVAVVLAHVYRLRRRTA